MDMSDIRESAVRLEDEFFARENARLLEELREKSAQEERREMLRKVVRIKDEAFLDRLIAMGIGPETALALRVIPLVFVAWADGDMDEREREAILKAAQQEGLASAALAKSVLQSWLNQKPSENLLQMWKEYVGRVWGRFSDDEQLQMRQNLLTAAEEIAGAAGGFLGLAKISQAEKDVIEDLQSTIDR